MKKFGIRQIIVLAMLVALDIVLSRFLSINAWNLKVGFEFIPVVVAAMLYGWLPAGIVAALADFIGAIAFPVGPYFPGLTLSAFLIGIVFGMFLKKDQGIVKIILSVLIVQVAIGLLINTLWISILYGTDYLPTFISRLPQIAIMFVVEIFTIKILSISINKIKESTVE